MSYVSLRLLKPECDLSSSGWCDEGLGSQASRALSQLYCVTVPPKGMKRTPHIQPVSAPTFAYCFYLLKAILESHGNACSTDSAVQETVMLKSLKVIATHAQLRMAQSDSESQVDEVSHIIIAFFSVLKVINSLKYVTIIPLSHAVYSFTGQQIFCKIKIKSNNGD